LDTNKFLVHSLKLFALVYCDSFHSYVMLSSSSCKWCTTN